MTDRPRSHEFRAADVRSWISEIAARDRFICRPMPFSHSKAWSLREGAIRHQSSRFFDVVGLTWEQNGGRRYQAFIDQPEIGNLVFAMREGDEDVEFLCQAKAEPGNVGIVQIAPTYQATASNEDGVHGGALPPYADYFAISKMGASSSLQSEQGSRFYRKRNRNALIEVSHLEERDVQHRWVPSKLLRQLLTTDFLVNTDARSVLVSSDWRALTNDEPFGSDTILARRLSVSYCAEVLPASIAAAKARLLEERQVSRSVEIWPVDAIPGWDYWPETATPLSSGSESIRHICIHSETREVTDWDQPIFSTQTELEFTLLCGREEGILKFAFRPLWEPGLLSGAELAPTIVGALPEPVCHGHMLASVRQSDEGGRFLHDVARYSVIDIGTAFQDDNLLWLTLAEIQHLLPFGHFNNEARSALSLILRFL